MHRTATLEQTWRRFSPKRARAGITRLADLTGLDTLGIPVFAAIRPLGKSLSTQQGKGTTPEAARISALMEALETWSAENITLPVVRGSYRALAKKRAVVDIRKLPRAAKKLDLDARLEWIRGRVLGGDEILVPLQSVTLDTTFTKPPVFDISSNGLGAGNTIDEAIFQGFCEVLERDAEAAWRRSGSDRRILLDTIPDRSLIDRITSTGARMFLWDISQDIPAIGCAIMEDPTEVTWRPLGMYQGFGAHVRPEVAIVRAIVEAAQTRLTYIAGGRDDFFPFDYDRATDPELMAELWERLTSPCDEPVVFDDLPQTTFDELLAAQEQVIVVDLTHPKLRVPCVKVLIPGRATDVEALG